ncbi:MAG: hypothetical protein E3J23_02160 [Candidatus Stahlbacteria bacterium]|nr:MAG: hypothetical protein E3J23_02160 [Candidatus Stahlbacteria bacterium]
MADEVEKLEEEISFGGKLSLRRMIFRVIFIIVLGAILIITGTYFRWDKWIIGGVLLLAGFVTQAWSSLISLIGSIPGVGHVIVKFLALPLLLIINGIGNIIAFLAIKLGYKKEILDTRLLTWAFALGAIIGFIIGELL